jgi:hypothetical protein
MPILEKTSSGGVKRLAVGGWQSAVGSRRLAFGGWRWQLAVGGWWHDLVSSPRSGFTTQPRVECNGTLGRRFNRDLPCRGNRFNVRVRMV